MFLASDFASVGVASLIIPIFFGISILALVSFLISLPKSLRKHGRRMSLVSAVASALMLFGAICLLGSVRILDSNDSALLGILCLPLVVSIIAVTLSRRDAA